MAPQQPRRGPALGRVALRANRHRHRAQHRLAPVGRRVGGGRLSSHRRARIAGRRRDGVDDGLDGRGLVAHLGGEREEDGLERLDDLVVPQRIGLHLLGVERRGVAHEEELDVLRELR
eukprot:7094691-Prymnesium_polylepis.1